MSRVTITYLPFTLETLPSPYFAVATRSLMLYIFSSIHKFEKYDSIAEIHTKAKFSFIYQQKDEPYGTATPVKIAKEIMKDEEAFLALMADDFIFNSDGSSEVQRMIDLFNSTEAVGLMTCVTLDKEAIQRYAVVDTDVVDGKNQLKSIIEKPDLNSITTNFANISKYIFTPKVFEILDQQQVNPDYNEFVITDTVQELTKYGKVLVHASKGSYIDSGDVKNWLKANIEIGKAQGLLD